MVKKIKVISITALVVLCLFIIKKIFAGNISSIEDFQVFMKSFGATGPIVLTLIQALQVVIPILPGYLGCAVGAISYGTVIGFICNYIGISAGSIIAFFLAYLLYSRIDFIENWIFPLMIILLGGGFIAGIEIRKPNIAGKIAMIVVGVLELFGVFILSGADLL